MQQLSQGNSEKVRYSQVTVIHSHGLKQSDSLADRDGDGAGKGSVGRVHFKACGQASVQRCVCMVLEDLRQL